MRKAGVTISKCMKTGKLFGIRWEKSENDVWEATWSFKIPDSQKESVGRNSESNLSGQFHFPPTYRGCPHCQGRVNVRCVKCGDLYCHNIEQGYSTICPWCGFKGQISAGGSTHHIPGKPDR